MADEGQPPGPVLVSLEEDTVQDTVLADANNGLLEGNVVDAGPTLREPPNVDRVLRVLYIFAGDRRRCDVYHYLSEFQQQFNYLLVMREIDLLRGADQDITDESFWADILVSIDNGEWDAIVVTPPCNTFSRSRESWKTHPGPRPIRDRSYPYGFPWLRNADKRAVEQANSFIDKSIECYLRGHRVGAWGLLEHPEDLGVCSNGRSPASIWQLPEIHDLQADTGSNTFAFFQCDFTPAEEAAATSKPTRFLTSLPDCRDMPYSGWPVFDEDNKYVGPLPASCPHGPRAHTPLIGTSESGGFKTSPAAAYPPGMCKWMAMAIIRSKRLHILSSEGGGGCGCSH